MTFHNFTRSGVSTPCLARTLKTKLRCEPAGFPPSDKRLNDYYYHFLYRCRKRASWSWRVYSTSPGASGGQSDSKCKMTKNVFTIPAQERGGRRAQSPAGGWNGLWMLLHHTQCVSFSFFRAKLNLFHSFIQCQTSQGTGQLLLWVCQCIL